MPDTLSEFLKLVLSPVGPLVLETVLIWAIWKGQWHTGGEMDRLLKERDERELSMRARYDAEMARMQQNHDRERELCQTELKEVQGHLYRLLQLAEDSRMLTSQALTTAEKAAGVRRRK